MSGIFSWWRKLYICWITMSSRKWHKAMAEWNTYYREMLRFLTTSGIWFSAFMLAIFLDLKSSTEFAWPIRCMKTQTLRVYPWQKSSCFERSRYRSHAYYNFYQPNMYWFVVCYSCRLSTYGRCVTAWYHHWKCYNEWNTWRKISKKRGGFNCTNFLISFYGLLQILYDLSCVSYVCMCDLQILS